jgi:hypothetical protein
MLVAGEDTQKLGKFLNDRGSLDVKYMEESLYRKTSELKNNIYRIDKLVYVYNSVNMNVREDMQILQELLLGSSYFNVAEVIFFVSKSEVPVEGVEFIKFVMDEVPIQAASSTFLRTPNFNLKISNDKLSFGDLYNSLLGITEELRVSNTFKSVYRVERGNDSNYAYEAEDTELAIIEPFSYRKVTNYVEMQDNVLAAESGEILVEDARTYFPDKVDVDLGSVSFFEPTQKVTMGLVSGLSKSGITTFVAAAATSAATKNIKSLLLDLTKNKGLSYILESARVPFENHDIQKVLLGESVTQESTISILSEFDYKLRFHVLRHVLANISRFNCDLLLIDVSQTDFCIAYEIIKRNKCKVLLTSTSSAVDITEASDLFSVVSKADLVLTEHINFQQHYSLVSVEDIKASIRNIDRIAKVNISHFDLTSKLYDSFFEVR